MKVMFAQDTRRRKAHGYLKREDEDIVKFTGTRIGRRKPRKLKITDTRQK